MMDWTDRHCRYFMRLLSPGAGRYTEMVTAAALQYGDAEILLRFDPGEHPVPDALVPDGTGASLRQFRRCAGSIRHYSQDATVH